MGQHMGRAGCESTVDFVQKWAEMFQVKRTGQRRHNQRDWFGRESVSRETLFRPWPNPGKNVALVPLFPPDRRFKVRDVSLRAIIFHFTPTFTAYGQCILPVIPIRAHSQMAPRRFPCRASELQSDLVQSATQCVHWEPRESTPQATFSQIARPPSWYDVGADEIRAIRQRLGTLGDHADVFKSDRPHNFSQESGLLLICLDHREPHPVRPYL
jgi:hypothetical protein